LSAEGPALRRHLALTLFTSPPLATRHVGWQENVQAAVEAGGIDAIVEVLNKHPTDSGVLKSATSALTGLITDAKSAELVVKAGGINAAMKAITQQTGGEDDEEVAEEASALTALLARYCQADAGAPPRPPLAARCGHCSGEAAKQRRRC